MNCPRCEKLLKLVSALKQENKALVASMRNSRRSLDCNGRWLETCRKATREAEKAVEA